jgi:predicted RND superfamily exporter protein
LAPLLAVVVADLWAMGALLLGGVTFNILSVLVPTLVVVIGVADGIHLTARFRDRVAGGQERGEALRSTFRELLLACFLTTFTTAAGFFSLAVADTRVIRDFGLQAGVAMGFCLAALLVVLPVILAVVPLGTARVGSAEARPLRRPLAWLETRIHRYPMRTLVLCVVFSLGATWLGSGVRPNSRLLEMYGPETATYKAVNRAQDQLTGVIPIFFYVEGEPDSMVEPAALERLLALEEEMRTADGVVWTSSPAAWIGQLHSTLGGEGRLPATREGVAQELLLAEISGAAPVGEVLDEGRGKARVIALVKDIGGRETLALRERWQAKADELYAGTGQRARLTGDGLLAAIGVNNLIGDLISGIGLVFVVIALTLAALLKDIRLALLACIPNLVPLLFSLATLRLIGADLQTSNIVSFTVAVGLAVDDTIHFSVAYHEARREGHNVADSIRRTLVQTGDGIVFTSVLLVAGFGILTWSDLTSTKHFGLLTSVTMAAALLGDLVLFPALLHLLDRRVRVS